jgi:hypothetical protein
MTLTMTTLSIEVKIYNRQDVKWEAVVVAFCSKVENLKFSIFVNVQLLNNNSIDNNNNNNNYNVRIYGFNPFNPLFEMSP